MSEGENEAVPVELLQAPAPRGWDLPPRFALDLADRAEVGSDKMKSGFSSGYAGAAPPGLW